MIGGRDKVGAGVAIEGEIGSNVGGVRFGVGRIKSGTGGGGEGCELAVGRTVLREGDLGGFGGRTEEAEEWEVTEAVGDAELTDRFLIDNGAVELAGLDAIALGLAGVRLP